MNNDNLTNFSDVPSLDDVQGLEDYLNNESLRQAGLGGTPSPAVANSATETPVEGAGDPAPAPSQSQYTTEQVNQLIEKVNALQAQLAQNQQIAAQQAAAAQRVQQPVPAYSAQQKQFIQTALERGYSLEQIQRALASRGVNPAQSQMQQDIEGIKKHLQAQEYQRAESEFINRISAFGDKWGLSEKDLVTFGQVALQKGINIAHVTDLETVFRAVYPEQYNIRKQRMSNTNTSQIYGGTSIPESNRAMAAKAEDAYVDAFIRQTMPNQYYNHKK